MIRARRFCLRGLAVALASFILGASNAYADRSRARRLRPHAPVRHATKRPATHARLHHSPAHHASSHHGPSHHSVSHRAPSHPIRPVIVIDPGHGGADPGTVGRSGTLEKTVTLATALQLARLLNATKRYQVLLTRHDDHFVSLSERAAFGRAHNAALMISLHADASPDHSARGTSVYIRSNGRIGPGSKGTTASGPGKMAQALGKAPPPEPGSEWLQYTMIGRLNDEMEMTEDPARTAHFWVLANEDIPGVLIEMGFLSNREDERLMRNPRHRLLIARLIRDAVEGYFKSVANPAATQTF
jgi:N-acetylmuramoyl-L-alanine amidase